MFKGVKKSWVLIREFFFSVTWFAVIEDIDTQREQRP